MASGFDAGVGVDVWVPSTGFVVDGVVDGPALYPFLGERE